MTVTAQDDRLTAEAWATCGPTCRQWSLEPAGTKENTSVSPGR